MSVRTDHHVNPSQWRDTLNRYAPHPSHHRKEIHNMAIHYPLGEGVREEINKEFFLSYDTDHWFFKIKMYSTLLENTEEFVDQFGDEELQEKSTDSFHRAIESEIVFTFYHITESLFMLLAVCDSVIPWVEMKHIRASEIFEFLREVVIEKDWEEEDLERIFYPDIRAPDDMENAKNDSLEFIEDYLARMGALYLDNDIYNEYKHGMRLSTTQSRIQMAPEKEPMGETLPVVFEREGTAHVYLEEDLMEKDGKEEYYQLKKVTSGFDYELFLDLCYVNYLLIDQIVRIRKARHYHDEGKEDERIEVNSFHEFDVDEVFEYDHGKDWEFRFSYPVGEETLSLG